MAEVKQTPLHDQHIALGARMSPFGGYLMPVQYSGIIAEHEAVRKAVGLFDVSHMGEFQVTGSGAARFLQHVTINDIEALAIGQAQYSAMCYPDGGMVDDLLVYRREQGYMIVVNAANIGKDFEWLQSHAGTDVDLEDASSETALLALQGPRSRELLATVLKVDLAGLPFYHFMEIEINRHPAIVSRTGYTGELGFEVYLPPADAPDLWSRLLEQGAADGIQPAGLGARDTLRLEMKYCLYGNDISKETNPIEVGLGWITNLNKGPFVGSDILARIKADGPDRRLVCLAIEERAIPRPGYAILSNGAKVGSITSGTHSPTLKQGIALGFAARGFSKVGTGLQIEIRGKLIPATVVKPPFVQETSLMA